MIFYVFLDGIGFGEDDPSKNPFSRFPTDFFAPLVGKTTDLQKRYSGIEYLKTDASLGVPGLPQSATGQTTLWTGINGSKALGRHVSGFPTFTLKKIILEYSMVKILSRHGYKIDFLNCYSPGFFSHIQKNPKLVSTSTLIQMASERPLKTLDDLRNKQGIYMDINHKILKEMFQEELKDEDPLLEILDEREVGKQVWKRFSDYDLALYEFFITDKVGHAKDFGKAEEVIHLLDNFFQGVLETLDFEKDQLIITSDHGNLEDLSTDVHTKNLVPTILYGKFTKEWKDKIQSLADIVPCIYNSLGVSANLEYSYPAN